MEEQEKALMKELSCLSQIIITDNEEDAWKKYENLYQRVSTDIRVLSGITEPVPNDLSLLSLIDIKKALDRKILDRLARQD